MPDETEIQKLSEYANQFFVSRKHGEDSIYLLRDRYPTWIYDMVYAVHDKGNWYPDDYKYQLIVEALDHLSEGMNPEEPELEADVDTSDLLKWFSSHRERMGIVDEAVDEFGWDKERGIEGAISMGQWREKEDVFRRVVEALRERLNDIESGTPEEFKNRGRTEGVLDWEPTD